MPEKRPLRPDGTDRGLERDDKFWRKYNMYFEDDFFIGDDEHNDLPWDMHFFVLRDCANAIHV